MCSEHSWGSVLEVAWTIFWLETRGCFSWVLREMHSQFCEEPWFWGNTDFYSGCISLHSPSGGGLFPIVISLTHELLLLLLILVILTCIRWILKVVLVCIALMAKMVKISLSFLSYLRFLLRILCLDLYPNFLIEFFVLEILVSWGLILVKKKIFSIP